MLSIQNKSKNTILVGAKVPPQVHSYLVLWTLAKGTYKTRIIRKLIETWILSQKVKETDNQLVQQIVNRINSQWMVSKKLNLEISFLEFKNIIEKELFEKGLLTCHISTILKDIKQ